MSCSSRRKTGHGDAVTSYKLDESLFGIAESFVQDDETAEQANGAVLLLADGR